MRIPVEDFGAASKPRRRIVVPGLLTLCVAVMLGFAPPAPAQAAEDIILSANLMDLLRGSKDTEELDAKPEAPEDTPTTKEPAKKNRQTTATPKKVDAGATRLAVVGDSLAQDLWFGVQRHFRKSKDVKVVRFTKSASGLVRDDNYDWNKKLKRFIRKENFDIAVVVFGGNDRQEIRLKGKRLPRFGEPWTAEYGNRVDRIIELLKSEADTIFWVGLPVVRSGRMEKDYKKLYKIYRARAAASGIQYVDIWHLFRDEDGEYTSFGPDLRGVKRRLRQDDGLHFTLPGQGRFADEVVKIMRKTVQLSHLPTYPKRADLGTSLPVLPVPGG